MSHVKSYGQPAVDLMRVFNELAKDIHNEGDPKDVLEVGDVQSDGHGLNFLVKLGDGWKRVIITSA